MKRKKLFLFTLLAFFMMGFAVNVNADDIATLDGVMAEDGVIKLTSDLVLENQFQYFDIIDETLDLNGHNIYTNGHDLTAIGTVSIVDSSQEKTGKISNGPGSTNSSVLIYVGITSVKSNLTLESGTIEAVGNSWPVYPVNGDFIMNGGTINLEYIFRTYGGNITINGGTINSTVNSSKNLFDVTANKKLTINGGTINNSYTGSGTISIGTIDLKDNASFEMNGGTINSNMSGIVTNSNNDVTINGGTIHSRAFSLVGSGAKSNTNFTINDGTLISDNSAAIYAPQVDGKTTIKNGKFTGLTTAVEVRSGELTITGGTFTSTADEYTVNANGNGTTTEGSAVAVVQHSTKAPINVSISGGTFNACVPFTEANPQENSAEDIAKIQIAISGGTFNSTCNEVVRSADFEKFITGGVYSAAPASKYIAAGYEANNDGTGEYVILSGLKAENITLSKTTYEYTGKAITPSVVVKYGDKTLVKDTDYTVTYKNNVKVGTATVVVTGKGNYSGSASKTFTITGIKFTVDNTKMNNLVVNKIYTKKAVKQNITFICNGKTLKEGTDYVVTYDNNVNIGKAIINVIGKGNYAGKIRRSFYIKPVKIAIKSISTRGNSITYSYYAAAGGVKYQVAYKQAGNKNWKFANTTNTSYKARYLKYNTKYYLKVRTYKVVNGLTFYGAWSDVKTKTIRK